MQNEEPLTPGRTYIWVMSILLGMPVLCGVIVVTTTFVSARNDVRVWRGEFQYALDQQCPGHGFQVTDGEGKVYLDAYQFDYQWESGKEACMSDGQIVRCTCSPDDVFTLVTAAQTPAP